MRRRQRTRKCGEMLFFHACTMSKSLSSHSANAQKGVGEPWFLVISSSSTSQKHNISTLSGHIEFASGELSFFPFKRYHAKQRDATRKLGKAEVRGRTERTADLENPLTNERWYSVRISFSDRLATCTNATGISKDFWLYALYVGGLTEIIAGCKPGGM